MKVGGLTPEADAERVGLIRKTVGKDVALMLDANQGWDLPTAIRAAKLCEPHDIFWLEDPMPWFDERHTLARLKEETRIPIAAGETEYTPFGLRTMVGGRPRRLPDHRLHVGGRADDVAEGRRAGGAVPDPDGRAPRSADPRARRRREPDRLHPRIVRGCVARSALVRAVPRAPGDRRRRHGVPDQPGLGLELREDTLEKYGVKLG